MLKRPVYLWRFFYIYRGEIIGKRNFFVEKIVLCIAWLITFTLYLWCDRTVKNIQLIY